MFTGALAASYYGTPRTTVDVDIVVNVSKKNAQILLVEPLKKAKMRVDEQEIHEAFRSNYKIITVRDKRTSFTLDIILSDRKLEKRRGTILGLPTFYQTPEDLIISKLRMIKATIPKERALKDKDDVRAVLKHARVNTKAVKKRAQRESTLGILEELMEKTSS